jgi:epoxyqueuosine reductase QueG
MEDAVYSSIVEYLKQYPKVLYGISDISYSEYSLEYKCALVVAVPHSEMLSLHTYSEEKFESVICEARKTLDVILSDMEGIFDHFRVKYFAPPAAQTSEETLLAPFSFKFAAVNAGIGWIGKNDVVVTEEFGPRIALSTILVDYDLPYKAPILQSTCSSDCMLCKNACPHNALSGNQWNITAQRNELINYQLCNQKRSAYIKSHNRKNSCGLCMVVCPYGL